MKYWLEKNHPYEVSVVGGKGHHLQKLVHWKAHVADFFVITTDTFRYFRQNQTWPSGLADRMEKFLRQHPSIALRSSMIAEDQVDSSFAGLFETTLYVTKSNWEQELKNILNSVDAPRVQEYIERKKLTLRLEMAVVAQRMIEVEKSGVLFTRSPVPPTSLIAIDAGFGLGEGVVSGKVPIDHFQFSRTFELIERKSEVEVLSPAECDLLLQEGLRLEKRAGFPCDIEWGMKEKELFIFQIRPITRTFEKLYVLVDTNLSESYPGVVSPFTAAFVKNAYEYVFSEACSMMNASAARLALNGRYYKKLITAVDHHLYYDLENYYAVLRTIPGGEKNIEGWHKMIGGKLDGIEIPYHDTNLSPLENIQGAFALFKMAFRHKAIFDQLLIDLESKQKEILLEQSKLQNSRDSIFYLDKILKQQRGFGLTVLNDTFIMMALPQLIRMIKKKGMLENQVVDLLKTSEGVDSLKPLELFSDLISHLSDDFMKAFSEGPFEIGINPYRALFDRLNQKGFSAELYHVKNFLTLYGDRSFEELKIESLPLRNNSELFYQLLHWARQTPLRSVTARASKGEVDLGWAGNKLLHFTRRCIATREATRLWRGKYYHLVRSTLLILSEQVKKEHRSFSSMHTVDVFSLTIAEWRLWAERKISDEEVLRLMDERKTWQHKKATYPEILIWDPSEKLPEFKVATHENSLSGQGVSPGITEAMALVLDDPTDAFDHQGDYILVTKNTDPAWVYIMSRSKGLISEKGSLLSHTAIIGRELNIPTVVGVRGATTNLKTGDRIRIDGSSGMVEKL